MAYDWVGWQDWHGWIVPLAFVFIGIVGGKLIEHILNRAIHRFFDGHAWLSAETMTRLINGNLSGIITLGGIYLATFNLPIERLDVVNDIRKILFIGSMLIAIRFTITVVIECLRKYAKQAGIKNNFPNTSIFENLIRIAIFTLGLLVILQTLGVSILPIVTALGVGGLAISLALQDTLANLFAGLHMIVARQIKVGDTIKLEGGQTGIVKDIGWRTTTIRQLDGNLIILPNGKMASTIIVNYTTPHPDLNVVLAVPVALDSNLEQVEALSIEVAKDIGFKMYVEKHPKRKNEAFEPFVRYQSYGEAWVNMSIYLPFKSFMDPGEVRHYLLKALHQRFVAEGAQLPFPQHIVHLDSPQLNSLNVPAAKN